jgi:hypothetical protein
VTEENSIEGGCACGEVRYRMTSKPLIVHCCHCTWCQRESGSAFALNAMIEAQRVELIQGEPETTMIPSNSGEGQKFSRCPSCRITLWSNYAGAGDAIRCIRVGSLDQPDQMPPDVHIFTSTKQDWVTLSDEVPVFEEYYRAKEVWPQESQQRYKTLKSS